MLVVFSSGYWKCRYFVFSLHFFCVFSFFFNEIFLLEKYAKWYIRGRAQCPVLYSVPIQIRLNLPHSSGSVSSKKPFRTTPCLKILEVLLLNYCSSFKYVCLIVLIALPVILRQQLCFFTFTLFPTRLSVAKHIVGTCWSMGSIFLKGQKSCENVKDRPKDRPEIPHSPNSPWPQPSLSSISGTPAHCQSVGPQHSSPELPLSPGMDCLFLPSFQNDNNFVSSPTKI